MSLNGIRHCTSCGREFVSKPGRIERLCPECYWAQKEQSGANSFSAKLFPSVNAAANGFNKPFYMVVLSGGYDHRAELKEAGYLFTGLETRTYAFLLGQHREIEDLKLQKTSAAFCGRGTLNFPCWGMAN